MEANNPMDTIPVSHLCMHYQTDTQFFEALQAYGLITVIQIEQTPSIKVDQIREVEKWVHLHYDLNINMEGLDAIANLLQRIQQLQLELSQAKNRLRGFEEANREFYNY